MKSVEVRPFFNLRNIIRKERVEIEIKNGFTVREVIDRLIDLYGPSLRDALIDPERGDIRSFYWILLNGMDIRALEKGIDTELKGGEIISIMQSVAGGKLN
jgi:MoaD family protein